MRSVILNFHGIGPILRQVDDAERTCWLDLEQFEAVLDLVRNQPHVFLTFDDGNISDVDLALPVLLHKRLTATFFVCTGRLGRPTFLGREHVRHLQAQGMRIGSHGVAHRTWRRLSLHEVTAELYKSRQALEDICGMPVLEAACPFGAYDRVVLRALQSAGYQKVYTSDGGWTTSSSWLQARNTVLRSHSINDVARLVRCRPHRLARMVSWSRRLLKQCR